MHSELAAIGILHAPLIIILISQMFLAIDCARSISRQVQFRSNRNGLSKIHIQFDTIFENTALAPGINRRPDSPTQKRPNEESSRSSDSDQRLGSHFFLKNILDICHKKQSEEVRRRDRRCKKVDNLELFQKSLGKSCEANESTSKRTSRPKRTHKKNELKRTTINDESEVITNDQCSDLPV